MRIKLASSFPDQYIELEDSIINEVIFPKEANLKSNELKNEILKKINSPINFYTMEEWLKKGDKLSLIVPDSERRYPYEVLFSTLFPLFEKVKISELRIVVASGTHTDSFPPYFDELIYRLKPSFPIRLIYHDSKEEDSLELLTTLDYPLLSPEKRKLVEIWVKVREKRKIKINKEVLSADKVISLGVISPHNIAGFSGGSKMIFPGVADYQSIIENHSLRVHNSVRLGLVENNIARDEMDKVGHLIQNYFILDLLDGWNGWWGVVAGNPIKAHRVGVASLLPKLLVKTKYSKLVLVSLPPPLSDTLYQLTKGVSVVQNIIMPGGVIIITGDTKKGFGSIDGIKRIVNLGMKNYLPEGCTVIAHVPLNKELVESCGFIYASTIGEAIERAYSVLGKKEKITVIPYGIPLLPIPLR